MLKNKITDVIRKQKTDVSYINAYNGLVNKFNSMAFQDIKNCNRGKRVAICGGGPSLSKYKVIPGVLHVALNRALLNDKINYDWFIGDDWDGINFFKDQLADYDCLKFFGHHANADFVQIPESFTRECNARKYYTDSYLVGDGFKSRFNCDIDCLPVGNMPNIALQALQIILYSNPEKILLVGIDASSNGHFTEVNLSKEQVKRHNKSLKECVNYDRVKEKWKEFKHFSKIMYPDTKIISVNPVGLKGMFKDVYQDQKNYQKNTSSNYN